MTGEGGVSTGIDEESKNHPKAFCLHQNYPNPFNPTTNIKFTIPRDSFVALKIYNLLGEEVAVLVNEQKSAGSYTVSYDGSKLSSGVYFYKITAGKYSDTKKLILLK